MTGWLILLALAGVVGLALNRFAGLPRGGGQLLAAALLIAAAGYAWQGSPGLPGRPTRAHAAAMRPDGGFATLRGSMFERFTGDAQVLATADAFQRQGLDRYAVGILQSALTRRPRSADLWAGLGNALVAHGEGQVTPAAELAFTRAARLSPLHPGPPFFLGLAYAQAGRLEQARATWSALLARSPADAPWRGDLEVRLRAIDAALR